MLFDNDNTAADVVNAMTEIFGDGAVMDSFRAKLTREQLPKQIAEEKEIARLAAKVSAARERAVLEQAMDMLPDFEIPQHLYHRYATAFRYKAEEVGVFMEGRGYECWHDEDFKAWYRKRWPQLCYHEAQRTVTITKARDFPTITLTA
jgi:phosphoglycolate phosphatase-like HAD superfamily hydrolase